MANVRKITHPRRKDGSTKTSWRATWTAPDGKRQSKNFPRKAEADAWLRDVGAGRVGGSSAMTVAELAAAHMRYFDGLVKAGEREAVTLDGYQTVSSVHLAADPGFARRRLCDLTAPSIQTFLDETFARTGSADLAARVRRTLVTWCKFGMRRGWLHANPAQACVVERTRRTSDEEGDGFNLPDKATLAALIAAAGKGPHATRDTAVVRLLMFGGLRISELLGLADDALVLKPKGATVRVRERLQRRHRTLGPPKSAKARRDVPVGEAAALAVRAWRLARGPVRAFSHRNGQLQMTRVGGRLFPAPDGGDVWFYDDFINGCWLPLMRRAELVEMLPDSKGKNRPVTAFSPHTLRHVAASLWIAQGLSPKKVQDLLGHSTIQLTMDLYGHLWTDPDADDALAQASERLVQEG